MDRGVRTLAVTAWAVTAGAGATAVVGSPGAEPVASAVTWWLLVPLTHVTVGALVAARGRGRAVGALLTAAGVVMACGGAATALAAHDEVLARTGTWLPVLGTGLPLLVLPLLPDGRAGTRTRRLLLVVLAAVLAVQALARALAPAAGNGAGAGGPSAPQLVRWLVDVAAVSGPVLALTIAAACLDLLRSYRRAHPPLRQQLAWVVLGAYADLLLLVGVVLVTATGVQVPDAVLDALFLVAVLTLPAAVGIAALRHRLLDVEVVLRRALVYGSLSALLLAGHLGVVTAAGALPWWPGTAATGLLATAAVAVALAPVRARVQRGVDHLLYGYRSEPEVVLSSVARRIGASTAPGGDLASVVEAITSTLRVPYAAIVDGEGAGTAVLAAAGAPRPRVATFPLLHRGERLGVLHVAARDGEPSLSGRDVRLLGTVAHQAAIAVHALHLTEDLRGSRERIVTAREEERRRVHHDLHDGLGPLLAAHALQIGLARHLLEHDPAAAALQLQRLEASAVRAVEDVRRLVHGLRPPALDELGLAGALRAHAEACTRGGALVDVEVAGPLPVLPAAVEVAAYLIATEAVTNVVRHAGAHRCTVSLRADTALHVCVVDDGRGCPAAGAGAAPGAPGPAGVGITSMRERAEELEGSLDITAPPGGGTAVRARLPLAPLRGGR